ncbi:MAG: hypothetical protein HYX72_14700 [Acidobacteria bacterium]|nr:hypothetical protein [Acidobacteriota bacterium]
MAEDAVAVYRPVGEWENEIVPALKNVALSKLIEKTGLSKRMLRKARNGHTKPHVKNQNIIAAAVREILSEKTEGDPGHAMSARPTPKPNQAARLT